MDQTGTILIVIVELLGLLLALILRGCPPPGWTTEA